MESNFEINDDNIILASIEDIADDCLKYLVAEQHLMN